MDKIQEFAKELEEQQFKRLRAESSHLGRDYVKTTVVPGKKYTKVDVGASGKYMIENATGKIFGIKGYGRIHTGQYYGTLETVGDYDWSGYRAVLK